MNPMHERIKEHFPTVLLTLLSIVAALALELLWAHLQESNYLYEYSITSVISWVQIAASFLGLMLIWVVYASNAMRLRWTPSNSDSVYPFFIGVMEFLMVDSLAPHQVGIWLIMLGVIFGVMVWVSHSTLRRARLDPDNDTFFAGTGRATLKDFYGHAAVVSIIVLCGIYLSLNPSAKTFALIATLGALLVLLWQFYMNAVFWNRSIAT